jgi:hypothetical protein
MKLLSATGTVFFSLFALLGIGYGQAPAVAPDGTSFSWKKGTSNAPVTADDVNLGIVINILTAGLPITTGSVHLHSLGDEVAVLLIKHLGSTPSPVKWTDSQRMTAVEMMARAFEHPKSITNPSDVTPKATNFLLNMLDAETEDPDIKAKISQAKDIAFKAAADRWAQ